jgi:uncharacterized linocin/CFP29 family protein
MRKGVNNMIDGEIIQGLDLKDLVLLIDKKSGKFQAILLQDIEGVISKDSPEFKQVRKLVLDSYNEYTRSVMRAIFGNDFEYISKKG